MTPRWPLRLPGARAERHALACGVLERLLHVEDAGGPCARPRTAASRC